MPERGFPAEMRARVLGEDAPPPPTEPLSKCLPAYDFAAKRQELEQLTDQPITPGLELGFALYPKVMRDYLAYRKLRGDVSRTDTETFLYGLEPHQEVTVHIELGKSLIVKLAAVGSVLDDVRREVHFELNGQPRRVRVKDHGAEQAGPSKLMADPTQPGQLAALMPGNLWSLPVRNGQEVAADEVLPVVEAMKLETALRAPFAARIVAIHAREGDRLERGQLLMELKAL